MNVPNFFVGVQLTFPLVLDYDPFLVHLAFLALHHQSIGIRSVYSLVSHPAV